MERQRHTKDTPHPMYDIIDNALSAAVDGYKTSQDVQHMQLLSNIHRILNLLVFHPEYSQEQQNS